MRYDISLTVDYAYDVASDHVRSVLHMMPLSLPGQQEVTAGLLVIDPAPQERVDLRDFFGNRLTWIAHHAPLTGVTFRLRAAVERMAEVPALDLSAPLDGLTREIAGQRLLDSHAPHHFLGTSPRTGPEPAMTDFARACVTAGMTTLEAVAAIGTALHSEMRFDAGVTDVKTPPGQAFAKRHGVCQDFSHVMIACLRGIGIPAGYVSGFLRTLPPEGQPRLEGSDAMHAWVRAWCGAETGWVEFDPTNDMFARQDHVLVALGRDYHDVAPVRATIRTAGSHETTHSVDMVAAPES